MLDLTTIDSRLREMATEPNPQVRWDETCEGSARALVIFVGPSPGGKKPAERQPMEKDHSFALWNESFDRPFGNRSTWWSPGFRVSWKPLVEAIFSADYDKIGRLVGRANMDWLGNPESKDVETQHMRDGAPSALKMIGDCSPELVLPMDLKAFDVLKEFLKQKGFTIPSPIVSNFTVLISDAAKKRFHRNLYAFRAKSSEGRSFLVIKLPQHPARIFRADYATRCGMAVRKAAFQIDSGTPVDVEIT